MLVVYVAGPYQAACSKGIQGNIDAAEEAGKLLLGQGMVPVIPHRISGLWDYDPMFQDWKHSDWLERFCIPLLNKCDAIYMMKGWINSAGSIREHQHASMTGKIILYHEKEK